MKRIKLSLYLKQNKPYILRNIFIDFTNHNKNLNTLINFHIEHIRESIFKNYIEVDLKDWQTELKNYLESNILNYSEIKRVFKISHKDTIQPKESFKEHLNGFLSQEYYINNILNI